jgi:hypothetical protein
VKLTIPKTSRILLCSLLCAALTAVVQAQSATEDQIKAAYVLNFARFVDWPPEALSGESGFNFCVLGRSRAADELDADLQGKSINGRPSAFRYLKNGEDSRNCQVIFVAGNAAKQAQKLLENQRGRPALLVGEFPGFAQAGGVMDFVVENGKVGFEVNLAAAEEAHLKLSSKLLSLARILPAAPEKQKG